ncbi:MAG: hypothetical protein DRR16_07015 [Candidatus Parabeggiatoa sp. nov. 3]|jgi:hypothetical protein|nr:MAG: hypothetical protein DRR00_13015 [Gammaproteobacteria bacterium]RKZ66527.1 MAG: hypothetical protein DRQ99_09445 [Gammaproteobacteria bacterium]RKZ87557.1 MAG: hypothetical protein DRR16_07015 [Gammaproteobacteria bacterium]
MKDIESLIWTMGEYEPSEDQLRRITDYVIERFSIFLKQEVKIYNTSIDSGRSATYFIYSGSQIASIFEIEWEGVLTVQLVDGKPYLDAQLLLFSRQYRLGLQEHEGQSVLIFGYERDIDSKRGEWRFLEWEKDFYGEWESYTKPSRSKKASHQSH